MKVSSPSQLQNLDGTEFNRFASKIISEIAATMNGNLSFADNLATSTVSVNFSTANKQVGVANPLGRVPVGYIPINLSANMVVYSGKTANTASIINLQASAVGTATLLVF